MDFEFSKEEQQFLREVSQFLAENNDPKFMDVTRENMADHLERFIRALEDDGIMPIDF